MNPTTASPTAPADPMAGFNEFAQQYSGPQFAIDGNAPATTPDQTQLPKSSGGFKGFLERNANTIGGILGGIGGEIVDPFGGGIAGAAAGQGIGQEIKDLTTGDKTNPFEQAAVGGVSQLAGEGVGKGLAAVGKGLKNVAPDVFRAAFNLSKPTAKALDSVGTSQKLLDYGMKGSLSSMNKQSSDAMDALDDLYRQSVDGIPNELDISGVSSAARRAFDAPQNRVLFPDDKVKDNLVQSILKGDTEEGTMPMKMAPQDAVDWMRSLQTIGHALRNQAEKADIPTEAHMKVGGLGDAYLAAGDHIQGLLDDASSKSSIKALQTDANKATLAKISPKLADEFMQAKTPQEIRTLMSPFYRLRTMGNITEANPAASSLFANALAATTGFGLGGPLGAAAGMVAAPVVQGGENAIRAPLTTRVATAMNRIGLRLVNPGRTITGKLTTKGAATTAASQAAGSSVIGNNGPTSSAAPTGVVSSIVGNSVDSTLASLNTAKNGGQNPSNMPSLAQILQAGGTQGLSAFLAYQKQDMPQLTDQQQKDWMDAQNAMNDVKSLANLYDKTTAQGAGVGQAETLAARIPGIQNLPGISSVSAWEDNKGDLASSLAQILGGGKNSKAMLSELKTELPDITDSPQAAAMKFQYIVSRLQQHMNTILAAPATNTPGQLTNFAGQSVPGTVDFTSPMTALPGAAQ